MTDFQTVILSGPPPIPNPSTDDETWPDTPETWRCHRLWFDTKTVVNLLKDRRDTLSSIEYNGLLRLALRLRQELAAQDVITIEPDCDAVRRIDSVLDQACFKPPVTPPMKGDDDAH